MVNGNVSNYFQYFNTLVYLFHASSWKCTIP